MPKDLLDAIGKLNGRDDSAVRAIVLELGREMASRRSTLSAIEEELERQLRTANGGSVDQRTSFVRQMLHDLLRGFIERTNALRDAEARSAVSKKETNHAILERLRDAMDAYEGSSDDYGDGRTLAELTSLLGKTEAEILASLKELIASNLIGRSMGESREVRYFITIEGMEEVGPSKNGFEVVSQS